MKRETAPPYFRRLGAVRFDLAAALGPLVDVLCYCAAIFLAQSAEHAQLQSFLAAVGLCYLPQLPSRSAPRGSAEYLGLALHLMVITALAFFLRSGVFVLATAGWGWPGQAAIVPAAIATALLVRPGYAYSNSKWTLGGAGWKAGAVGAITVAVALRLVYSGRVELLPEETYYWSYARHLDFGYLDHPPMVGWLIAAGTAAFGNAEFGVRIGALCCGAITAIFVYRLTRELFGEASGLAAVLLVQTLPFFFLIGMLMTPDAPLTAMWAAALYYSARALLAGRREAWWRLGLCLGFGLLSKYTIVLLGLSILLFMLLDPVSRRWFKRAEPYAAVVLALVIFLPVILWNAEHDWASFLFQTSRRLADRPQFALPKLIGSMIVLLTPTGIAAVPWLFSRRRVPADPGPAPHDVDPSRVWLLLKVAALVPFTVFALFSLRHEVKLDWTGAPSLAVVPALAFGIVHSLPGVTSGFSLFIRRAWAPTLIALLLLYGAGLYDLTVGIPGVGYGRHAELVPIGWRDLGGQVSAIAADIDKRTGDDPLIVGMDRYAIASELAFYSPDQVKSVRSTSSAHLFGQVGLMYERWFPPAAQTGRTLLLVAWNRGDLESAGIVSSVERLEPVQEGVVTRDNGVIRPYYYRVAYGYRGLTAP